MIRAITITIALDGTKQISIAKQGDSKLSHYEATEILQATSNHITAEAMKLIPQTTTIKQF
jgi:hypothetical protein